MLGPALLLTLLLAPFTDVTLERFETHWVIGGAILVLTPIILLLVWITQRLGDYLTFAIGAATLVIFATGSTAMYVWYLVSG